LNKKGEKIQLIGVNKAGSEFACIQGWSFWDGPDLTGTTNNIMYWKANIVRLPLNEQCWLNINIKQECGG
jgi:endoglucanase